MAEQQAPQKKADVAPTTLALAALGSVAATAVVSRFGLAGTLTGAALTPVVLTLVRELGRRPVQQVASIRVASRRAARPHGAPATAGPQGGGPINISDSPRSRVRRVRWPFVGSVSLVAFLLAVAVFTVPDLIAGQSIVSQRDSTFFSSRDDGPEEPAVPVQTTTTTPTETTPTETTPTETAPVTETTTVTVPVTTAPPPAVTAPPPAPAPEVPPPAVPTP